MHGAVIRECIGPLKLPEKELTQWEVERYWTTDRLSLRDCKKLAKHKTDWYEQLRKELNNGRKDP